MTIEVDDACREAINDQAIESPPELAMSFIILDEGKTEVDLGDRDGGDVEAFERLLTSPTDDTRRRPRSHELRQDVGVEQVHASGKRRRI